jgi:LmbE family N-acetylglucosaminyl deacetylase
MCTCRFIRSVTFPRSAPYQPTVRKLVLASLLVLFVPTSAVARVRAVRHPGLVPLPRSVMWIGAHPDDEATVAPLLSFWCREQRAQCSMVILTRGDAAECLLPGGCVPDVATVRAAEARASAEYFDAELTLLGLPDGGGIAPPSWPIETATNLRALIEAERPELVLTFDPRHGSTCHPDHRETANVVLEAVRSLSYAPDVVLFETRVSMVTNPFSIRFAPATASAERFDAKSSWTEVLEVMQRHPSQFDERWLEAIRNVPPSDRAVYFGTAHSILYDVAAGCP